MTRGSWARRTDIGTRHEGDATPPQGGANPVLWLVIALPLLSVVAGLTSWGLAATHGDRELPPDFHVEGGSFVADEARLAAAARLGVSAELRVDGVAQRCVVTLHGAAPAMLSLELTHPITQAADRHVVLRGGGGTYGAPCAPLAAAHWWLQLSDPAGGWMLRGRVHGTLQEPFPLTPQVTPVDARHQPDAAP
jgi:hypothetical protein